MQRLSRFFLAALLPCILVLISHAQPAQPAESGVYATIETTLPTAAKQIRMFAFDGDDKTYFASGKNPTAEDHFTLVFEKLVGVKFILVTTGKPDGSDKLDKGTLEYSDDGKTFEELTVFKDGLAKVSPEGKEIKAIRIKPGAAQDHPLAIREIAIHSFPQVAVYKYPVEYTLIVDDAPEMKEWGEMVVRVCERAYQWMGDELESPGYKPPIVVRLEMKSSYKGVAMAGGGRITGSVAYFKKNTKDVGAMVHETVHIQQQYKGRGNPGWLVEGLADYIRFFKYEPGKVGKFNEAKAKYNGSYRVTARFLDFVTNKYDKELVKKLNRAMRESTYKEEIWKDLTGKTVQELDELWKASFSINAKKGDK